jgi:hypothetical protein
MSIFLSEDILDRFSPGSASGRCHRVHHPPEKEPPPRTCPFSPMVDCWAPLHIQPRPRRNPIFRMWIGFAYLFRFPVRLDATIETALYDVSTARITSSSSSLREGGASLSVLGVLSCTDCGSCRLLSSLGLGLTIL